MKKEKWRKQEGYNIRTWTSTTRTWRSITSTLTAKAKCVTQTRNKSHVIKVLPFSPHFTEEDYVAFFIEIESSANQYYLPKIIEHGSSSLISEPLKTGSSLQRFSCDLVNLLALEEFKRKISYSVMLQNTDRDKKKVLFKAVQTADVFSLVHCPAFSGKKTQPIVKSGASTRNDVKLQ